MTHPKDFLLLYGTQTGQARAIAELLKLKCEEQQLYPRFHCVSSVGREFCLEKETLAVIVISTTGDGECPDTAQKLCRLLKRQLASGSLSSLRFALLGLGDTNHNIFCGCAKFIEKQLLDLGAEKFCPTGFCDDELGLEIVAEPWIEAVVVKLKALLGNSLNSKIVPPKVYNSDTPLKTMSDNELENAPDILGIRTLSCSVNLKPETKDDDEEDKSEERVSGDEEDEADAESADADHYKPNQTFYTFEKCLCAWSTPSLVHSDALQAQTDLHVPTLAADRSLFSCAFTHEFVNEEDLPLQNGCDFPSQASPLFYASVISRTLLTDAKARKEKYAISLDLTACGFTYEPGDALYFLCPNPDAEVNWLLYRLNLGLLSYNKFKIEAASDNPSLRKIPKYLPSEGNIFYLFKYCLNIRVTPSQSMLRMMANACDAEHEKRRLLELSSAEGRNEYIRFVQGPSLSLLDVLHAFPSCNPPVESLIGVLRCCNV
ncbi:unnamed protein product [Soboliphyme baturini]|uniref:Methionine synthase reductase n=1 Tax=Soboliphyme baturini TaxID=241478 RepID=A0A183IWJ2_9BILA|nr:unnamed protein product [Soboliphyme baturini]